jgi:hypothetical protein
MAKPKNAASKLHQPRSVSPFKSSTCSTLSGSGKLEYSLGKDASGQIFLRLNSNDGGGLFSTEWIAWSDVQAALKARVPITSAVLHRVFIGRSSNNPGYLLAVLVHLKLVESLPHKTRQYKLLAPPQLFSPPPKESIAKEIAP